VSAVAETLQRFGRVDIAINNAGGADSFSPFHELSDDQFRRTWELNFLSAVRIIRAVLPKMREYKWGRIINISSESAVQPDPLGADYNSAKGALNTLTKTLSKAYAAEGILVNTVSPAFTLTPLLRSFIERTAADQSITFDEAQAAMLKSFRPHIEVRRPGKPEDVAAAVAFLASELASFVNGADMRVDGGSVASV
jgi:NAD(P)-dependent dehydrogenase (short-subunit alcohol dehydrogenase family)